MSEKTQRKSEKHQVYFWLDTPFFVNFVVCCGLKSFLENTVKANCFLQSSKAK